MKSRGLWVKGNGWFMRWMIPRIFAGFEGSFQLLRRCGLKEVQLEAFSRAIHLADSKE